MTHPQTLSKRMTPEPLCRHACVREMARLGLGVLLASLVVGCGRRSGDHLIVLVSRVWRVNAQGAIAPFCDKSPCGYLLESGEGFTAPLPSPDGRWIAYGDPGDYDAHLLDVRTLRRRRITRFGRRPRLAYTFAATVVAGWSASSRRLLLEVIPGEADSDEGQYGIPRAAYGFHICDLASGKVSPLALPKGFEFAVWLPDGRFLGTVPGSAPCENRLVAFAPGSAHSTGVGPRFLNASQVKASAGYRWVVGVFGIAGCGESEKDEIAKIDLRTGKSTVLVPPAPWAENQWPELSPDGQHASYTHRRGTLRGVPQESLFLDRRQIYACPGMINYNWVDERTIALACGDEVLTLDTKTTKVLSRYRVAAPRARR